PWFCRNRERQSKRWVVTSGPFLRLTARCGCMVSLLMRRIITGNYYGLYLSGTIYAFSSPEQRQSLCFQGEMHARFVHQGRNRAIKTPQKSG
ncbi:MAG: hypothetical protein ABN490_22585, partial [Pantoea agglomerans]